MEISISKEILQEAIKNQCENDFIIFDCDTSCVENIGQLEIDELINDHHYEPDINDFVDLINKSKKIKLIKDFVDLINKSKKIKLIKNLKEQIQEVYADELDFILDFIDNSRLDEQEKQKLIDKLTQTIISVEQAQKCIALIREHNLRGGGHLNDRVIHYL